MRTSEQYNGQSVVAVDQSGAVDLDIVLVKNSMVGMLGEIEEIVGTEAALKIALARGGTRVDIPADPPSDHWLIGCIGETLARKLCKELSVFDADQKEVGLRHVVLPLGAGNALEAARQTFLAALKMGVPVRVAGLRAGVCERTAWRWLKKFRQMGLFTPAPRLTLKPQGKPRAGRKAHHKPAVLRELQAGKTNLQVAVKFGIGVGSISQWRRQFIAEGLLSRPEKLPAYRRKSEKQQQFEAMIARGIASDHATKVCHVARWLAQIWLGQMNREQKQAEGVVTNAKD